MAIPFILAVAEVAKEEEYTASSGSLNQSFAKILLYVRIRRTDTLFGTRFIYLLGARHCGILCMYAQYIRKYE